jgi:amino acid transporter
LTTETSPGADNPHTQPEGQLTLRKNYLSGFENVAQTLGTMAPTGTLGVIIPLVIGLSGNGTWLLILAVVGIYLLILFNINVFATRGASAGGLGTYPGLGIGPRAGAFTKWIYVIAMLFGAAGSAPSSAYYACLLINQTTGIPNTALLGAAVTTVVVAASWWTAYRDMKLSSDVMIVIEVTSLAVIIAIIALAMFKGGPWVDRPQLTLQGTSPRTFSAGLVLAFIMMGGFESATTLGEEAKHAERTIPRAIIGCVVPLGLLYVVMTYLMVGLGRKFGIALDQLEAPFDTLARAYHLPWLGKASSLGVALSYFACTLGSLNAGARALYSLAEDGLFYRRFAEAHPKNATPHRAIAVLSAISIAAPVGVLLAGCTLVACIDYLSQLAALGFIGSYFMVCLAVPFYLTRLGCLRWPTMLISATALILLAGVMVQSVYPVPPAPACYLPYVFVAIVAFGLFLSWRVRRQAPAGAPA